MNNGREKIGATNINWQEAAFGAGKNRRKTIGFGKYDKKEREWEDEIYLRELSIIEAGIGCALWDAGIILSRWIYDNASLFATKRVMELGSGVGLPGIIAARYSKEVYLTDYIEKLVENLEYNIKINTTYESDDEKSEDPAVQRKVQLKKNIKQTAKAMFFDWHDLDNQPDKCPAVEPVDILLGSELIYTGDPEHAKCLVRVIDKYLNRDPDAFFMHILSDDRDGVPNFIKFMDEGGFSVEIIPVPDKYMGNFNTKQRPETYKFYMFKRKTTSDAIVSSSNNNELITK
eukprot:GEZU01009358.1.p1 GENE.GEZU01009358.1~~GEZU01009358.1.p1  ORF type:complete len:288 (+),score=83.16 GEZU01009358.1:63-926(+)